MRTNPQTIGFVHVNISLCLHGLHVPDVKLLSKPELKQQDSQFGSKQTVWTFFWCFRNFKMFWNVPNIPPSIGKFHSTFSFFRMRIQTISFDFQDLKNCYLRRDSLSLQRFFENICFLYWVIYYPIESGDCFKKRNGKLVFFQFFMNYLECWKDSFSS